MSGLIQLDEEVGFSTARWYFSIIVERTREAFNPEHAEYLLEIYDPLDKGMMYMLTLEGQEKAGFMAFYRATGCALDEARQEAAEEPGSHFTLVETFSFWEDLIGLLRKDPRYEQA